jgi:ADP-ribosylglycohydrolase
MINYTKRSLEGIWVGDCIGNLGQLYFVHDILKALESGLVKFGGQLDRFQKQFVYSDDTEEAIVLYNHLVTNKTVDQNKLAMEFATRYMDRDPDGEIYGYGLNTRKVLRDIYEGVPWEEANKIIKKAEGMPSHIDSLVHSLSTGEDIKTAMSAVNRSLNAQRVEQVGKVKEGSCGNGSAMRVGVLGAFLGSIDENPRQITVFDERIVSEATLQSEVTHCHPEGIAGSIVITKLACVTTHYERIHLLNDRFNVRAEHYFNQLLGHNIPEGQVKEGIRKAKDLSFDTPIGKAIEVLGNGTHVTCQDTVPLCCWLAIKHLCNDDKSDMYEKAIIETSMAFGDVDTNCAIVGGIIGVVSPPPEKWSKFCNQCYKMIRSGSGPYVNYVPNRKVTIDPATRYDEGYYLNI